MDDKKNKITYEVIRENEKSMAFWKKGTVCLRR